MEFHYHCTVTNKIKRKFTQFSLIRQSLNSFQPNTPKKKLLRQQVPGAIYTLLEHPLYLYNYSSNDSFLKTAPNPRIQSSPHTMRTPVISLNVSFVFYIENIVKALYGKLKFFKKKRRQQP